MSEDNTISRSELLALTGEIVSAHVANNAVARDEVAPLIQSVFEKLNALASDEAADVGRAHAGGADPALGHRRLHRLPRRREEAEDAEAASDDRLQHDARGVPGEVGAEARLPDGGAELRQKRQELAKKIGLGRKPRVDPQPAPKATRSRRKPAA